MKDSPVSRRVSKGSNRVFRVLTLEFPQNTCQELKELKLSFLVIFLGLQFYKQYSDLVHGLNGPIFLTYLQFANRSTGHIS